ncbi:MAG TPA: 3-hydroxyacyl-ACP dehydratase FabZ family protein [Terrimicrobiaceae bacterium]
MSDPRNFGLPHREPFVFVDEIFSVTEGEAQCLKVFPPGDAMFRGHFPGNPIVPGVILTEALAQTAGIAGTWTSPGRHFLLSAIRSMKFPAAARPGQRINLQARKTGEMGGLWMFDVRAEADGTVVAVGQLVLNEAPPPPQVEAGASANHTS